jgi:hypothetical protein
VAIELVVHDDAVDLTFKGWDKLWAFSSGIHLPITEITDARVSEVRPLKKELGWRTGGGYWPGKMATGHFTWRHRKGVRQLWAVYGDKEALVIDTTRDKPARIVIQHPYKHDLAWLIAERIPSAEHPGEEGEPRELYDFEDEPESPSE